MCRHQGLPRGTVILPSNSRVHIVKSRRRIQVAQRQLELTEVAAWDRISFWRELCRDGFFVAEPNSFISQPVRILDYLQHPPNLPASDIIHDHS